jgi:hypothetical protein
MAMAQIIPAASARDLFVMLPPFLLMYSGYSTINPADSAINHVRRPGAMI